MKISYKIIIVFSATGLLMIGLGFLFFALSIPYIWYFLLLLLLVAAAGYGTIQWIATPLENFVHEMEAQHQEHFDILMDITEEDEILQLSKLNQALLQSLQDIKDKYDKASEDNAAHELSEANLKEQEAYFHRYIIYSCFSDVCSTLNTCRGEGRPRLRLEHLFQAGGTLRDGVEGALHHGFSGTPLPG